MDVFFIEIYCFIKNFKNFNMYISIIKLKRLLFENKIKAQWVSVFPKEQLRNFDQRKKKL